VSRSAARRSNGVTPRATHKLIFFLTSLFNGSTKEECNRRLLQDSMKMEGRIETMATKKKAKKKKK
jgi:hypothetical protein